MTKSLARTSWVFQFLRLIDQSMYCGSASPIEKEQEKRLLNSNFVDQQQIFFLGSGGKINSRGRERKGREETAHDGS